MRIVAGLTGRILYRVARMSLSEGFVEGMTALTDTGTGGLEQPVGIRGVRLVAGGTLSLGEGAVLV